MTAVRTTEGAIGITFALDSRAKRLDTGFTVSSRKVTNFRLAPEYLEALHLIKARHGISFAEQVRRALRGWMEQRGITIEPKTDRLRAQTRKRP